MSHLRKESFGEPLPWSTSPCSAGNSLIRPFSEVNAPVRAWVSHQFKKKGRCGEKSSKARPSLLHTLRFFLGQLSMSAFFSRKLSGSLATWWDQRLYGGSVQERKGAELGFTSGSPNPVHQYFHIALPSRLCVVLFAPAYKGELGKVWAIPFV